MEADARPIHFTGGPTELTDEESAERERCEVVFVSVARHLEGAANDLLLFKERRLFRSTHRSWSAYVEDRLPIGKRTADRWANFARIRRELGPVGPKNERQARALSALRPDQLREVARRVEGEWDNSNRVSTMVREVTQLEARLDDMVVVKRGDRFGLVGAADAGVLNTLDVMERHALRVAALGPYAVADSMRAATEHQRAAALGAARSIFHLAERVLACFDESRDQAAQDSWAMSATGRLADVRGLLSSGGPGGDLRPVA